MAFPGGQDVSSKYCNTSSCIFCPEYVDGFLMTVPSEEGSLEKPLEKYPIRWDLQPLGHFCSVNKLDTLLVIHLLIIISKPILLSSELLSEVDSICYVCHSPLLAGFWLGCQWEVLTINGDGRKDLFLFPSQVCIFSAAMNLGGASGCKCVLERED